MEFTFLPAMSGLAVGLLIGTAASLIYQTIALIFGIIRGSSGD